MAALPELKLLEAFASPLCLPPKAAPLPASALLDSLNEQLSATDSEGATSVPLDTLGSGVGSIVKTKHRVIEGLLSLRGGGVSEELKAATARQKVLTRYKMVAWNPEGLTVELSDRTVPGKTGDKEGLLLVNRTSCLNWLKTNLRGAERKLAHR